jgi:fumarate reductase flavoprotein subunit
MGTVAFSSASPPEPACDILVVGAGAAGLIAALRAVEDGASVVVLERDAVPRGSTALSAGLIPAAGTRVQRAVGIADSEALFSGDIIAKSHGEADQEAVAILVGAAAPAIDWLSERHGLPFSVIENFSYPGHRACRMHGLPSRSGAELMDRLREAAERAGIDIVTEIRAETLIADADREPRAMRCLRPDGTREDIGFRALVLACNGYGGSKSRVARHIPALADALYFGHPGNQGDALDWGEALGLRTRHLAGHQGHGSVAHPHGILISWATMTEGGFQVNGAGERFSDESRGYSEQAEAVLAQPDGIAWSIFDERIAAVARQFEDFRQAEAAGAVLSADGIAGLAQAARLPAAALADTVAAVERCKRGETVDAFGRGFEGAPQLSAPYRAVRVTGALFHTQGGLVVDGSARVVREDGTPVAHVFAAGGAACGVSGSQASGYLSGNGLLSAVGYGFIAGRSAAAAARGS